MSVHSHESDPQRWQEKLENHEQVLRLQELELEIQSKDSRIPIEGETRPLTPQKAPRWLRNVKITATIAAFSVGALVVFTLAKWIAGVIVIAAGLWVGYKVMFEPKKDLEG